MFKLPENSDFRFVIAPDGLTAACTSTCSFDADQLVKRLEMQGISPIHDDNDPLEVVVERECFEKLRHLKYVVEEFRYPSRNTDGREH